MDKHANSYFSPPFRAIGHCLVLFLFCLFVLTLTRTVAFGQVKSNILVLHSYNKGLEWTDNEDEGIMSVLGPHLDSIEVHTEYLDSKRNTGKKYLDEFHRFLEDKYASTTFRCIITTDDNALNFIIRNCRDLFPGVPVVFCGVNYLNRSMLAANRDLMTGVVESFDVPATLRAALHLEPDITTVAVINDKTTTGRANRKVIDEVLPQFTSRLKFIYLTDYSMAGLRKKVQSLDKRTIILLMTFNRDKTGHDYDYDQSIALISQVARVPMYGVWEFYLGEGIVGGMLTSGRIQGKTAAEMALRILDGTPVKDIPVVRKSPNRYMFDYRQLERFHFEQSRLPQGSTVVFQPPSFIQVHPKIVYGAIVAVVILALIIFFLLNRIHERRNSLQELEEAHRRTVRILESIADGFVAFDRDFRFTYVNTEAEKILGRNRADLIGLDHWVAIPFTVGGPIEELYRRVMATQEVGELEYLYSRPDRSQDQWIALKAYPAEDGGISAYFRDITEKKKAEQELVRLATAVEQLAEAVFITDDKWIIRYVNPAFENLTGYQKDEILGQHTRILKSEAHDASFYREIQRTLREGKVWSGRITSRRKDDSVFDSESANSPVYDASGKIINYVGVFRDITVELRLEKELRQAQKMEAIGTLAGGIAHDFNNILSIIIGFTEMAKMKLPQGSPESEHLQRVLDAGVRATDLVKQILTFSRFSEQEKKPIQIASFIKEALKLLRPLLPTTIEIHQEINVAPERTIVLMDPTEIHQVLMNLCTNAAHAMREKGGRLSVRVSELVADAKLVSRHLDLKPGSYVCLAVSDTGMGMDGATLERIFDPYFTTKELGVGTGLGLPVVQGIVRGHQGAVNVYSEPGRGTTINVYLPRIEGGRPAPATPPESFPPGSERILFVDDETNLAELGVKMLAPFGYTVTARTSSKEALQVIEDNPGDFDLIVTDMTMPGLNGVQLAEGIKAIRSDLPIVLCTGFSELVNEVNAEHSGIDAFLMKPYAVEDLLRTIHRVLGK